MVISSPITAIWVDKIAADARDDPKLTQSFAPLHYSRMRYLMVFSNDWPQSFTVITNWLYKWLETYLVMLPSSWPTLILCHMRVCKASPLSNGVTNEGVPYFWAVLHSLEIWDKYWRYLIQEGFSFSFQYFANLQKQTKGSQLEICLFGFYAKSPLTLSRHDVKQLYFLFFLFCNWVYVAKTDFPGYEQ